MKGVRIARPLATAILATSLLAFSATSWSELASKAVEQAKPAGSHAAHVHEKVTSQVNLNTADEQTLVELNGIGEKKAKDIITYREANGSFKSVDDLVKVKGISQKILDKNRSALTVN